MNKEMYIRANCTIDDSIFEEDVDTENLEVELFKTYYKTVENITDSRREASKHYFRILSTSFISLFSLVIANVFKPNSLKIMFVTLIALTLISIFTHLQIICINRTLKIYSNTNKAKFTVIKEYCKKHGMYDFYESEREKRNNFNNSDDTCLNKIYRVEQRMYSILFCFYYLITFIYLIYTFHYLIGFVK